MSHFSVLVIGNNIKSQLAPYHEFECTGEDDQYVQDIDRTAQAREAFASQTVTRLKDPDGNLYDPYSDGFYRDPTPDELKEIGPLAGTGANSKYLWTSKDWHDGKGYRPKIHFTPDGWQEVTIPYSEVGSLADFIVDHYGAQIAHSRADIDKQQKHKYGWVLIDDLGQVVEYIHRTNPNKKWDWWTTGGRWSDMLLLKDGSRTAVAFKSSVDFESMRTQAGQEAQKLYDKVHAVVAGREFQTWDAVRTAYGDDIESARKAYGSQPILHDLRQLRDEDLRWVSVEEFIIPRDAYVLQAEQNSAVTFALVKDGQWYEKGKMGWFACVSNEKEDDVWRREFNALLDGLTDDTLLTVVDCHI